jgi:acyl-CoA oxidase
LALLIAIRYSHKRKQFGDPEIPIIQFPNQQYLLFSNLATSYAIGFYVKHCKELFMNKNEKNMKELTIKIASAKVYTSWEANKCLQICRECCGSEGYISKNLIAGLKCDLDIMATLDGANAVLCQLISKHLLSEFSKKLQSFTGSISEYYSQNIHSFFIQDNEFLPDIDDWNNGSFLFNLFRKRERRLVFTLAKRYSNELKTKNPFDAWNSVQIHSLNLTQAFIERIHLQEFNKAIQTCDNEVNQRILKRLRSLYAVNIVKKDAWFLKSKFISHNRYDQLNKVTNILLKEILPHSLDLVELFEIPENILKNTISN